MVRKDRIRLAGGRGLNKSERILVGDDHAANYIDAALRALAVTAPECFKVFIILILYLL